MGLLHQFFSVDELKSLTAMQLEIIRAAIQNEIRTSSAVREAMRGKIRDVYDRLKAPDPPPDSSPQVP